MMLEEAYEAFEAVEEARAGRPNELRDELGDLLFQIIFYAQVAKERGEFSIDDVTDAIHAKMVRRHPHVFGEVKADDSATVLLNWETMKAEERRAAGKSENTTTSILDGVPSKAPALMEAHQLSTKAARVGFDWKNIDDIFDKLHEEIEELRDAINQHAEAKDEATHTLVREELGDLLFAATNIARHLHVEPEAALKLTNRKFRQRFRYIEETLRTQNRTFQDVSIDELESIWQEAKVMTAAR
jgi:MazG family protein